MNKSKGQIITGTVIGWGIIFALAFAGGLVVENRLTNSKIDNVKTENTITVQRVAVLEEAITTLKEDNKQIKTDLKEILRLVK